MKNTIKRLNLEPDATLIYLSKQTLHHYRTYEQTIIDFVDTNLLAKYK